MKRLFALIILFAGGGMGPMAPVARLAVTPPGSSAGDPAKEMEGREQDHG